MVRGIKKTRNMQEPMQKHWKEYLGRKPVILATQLDIYRGDD